MIHCYRGSVSISIWEFILNHCWLTKSMFHTWAILSCSFLCFFSILFFVDYVMCYNLCKAIHVRNKSKLQLDIENVFSKLHKGASLLFRMKKKYICIWSCNFSFLFLFFFCFFISFIKYGICNSNQRKADSHSKYT